MLVPINDIRVGKRLRGLREATIVELMESVGRLGLQCPISVATGVEKRPGNSDAVSFELVAGNHRLQACKRLGWEEIEANPVQLGDNERELWEIDENLCRADLTELERGEHLARRKEVYETLHPDTKRGANIGPERQFVATDAASFSEDTAEKIGADKRTVQRSIRRVAKIDAKVRERIRDNPEIADSGVELDALASLSPQQQSKAVALVEAGSAETIRQAKRLIEAPARPAAAPNFKSAAVEEEAEYQALAKAWNRARVAVRERFIADCVDRPVADNTSALRSTP